MIIIMSSPLVSYLSYEIMACDGWLEGFFTGTRSSHAQVVEGTLAADSVLQVIRITSFTRIGSNSPLVYGNGEVPSNAVGWFRFRNNTTNRVSCREVAAHLKLGVTVPDVVFCLATRELKGDVQLTQGINFAFYTINPPQGPGRKINMQQIQVMIANPDDSTQPSYPCHQIEHSFSIPWPVPNENANSDAKHRDSHRRAAAATLPIDPTMRDPSHSLVDYTKASYKKMLEKLGQISEKVQRHDSLIDL